MTDTMNAYQCTTLYLQYTCLTSKIKMKWTTAVLVFDESEYGLFPYFCSTTKVLHCMTLHKSQAEIKALSNLNTM